MNGAALFSCPEAPERFTAYLDGELSVADARDLDAHLHGCPACRKVTEGLAETHRDLALMTALDDASDRDPVPALIAKARWDEAAGSRRRTRARRSARRWTSDDPGRPHHAVAAISIAALLLVVLSLAAYVGTRSPRPIQRSDSTAERRPRPPSPAPRVRELPEPSPAPPTAPPTPSPKQRARSVFPAPVEKKPDAPPAPTKPEGPPPGRTVVEPILVARVVAGDGEIRLNDELLRPADGTPVSAGQTLRTGPSSRLTLVFPDSTRVRIGSVSEVRLGSTPDAIHLDSGELTADVRPRRAENRFIVTTSNARVRVLGTRLTVLADPDRTRVGVEKGRVRVRRAADDRVVFVTAGHFTVVAERVPLRTFPLEANLLPNPGLEAGQTGWRWPSPVSSPDAARTGSRSLRVDAVRRINENRQEPAVTAGARYRASVWAKTKGLEGRGAVLRLVWHDASGRILRTDDAGRVSGTRDWTFVTGTFTAPAGAVATFFQVLTEAEPDGAGTAWFDDCSFVRLSP